MKTDAISIEIRGISPLLMHKYIGEQPSKPKLQPGKKTEAWINEQRLAGWIEAAYWANGTFHIPPENIEAMLIRGAVRNRKGNDFKQSVAVLDDFVPMIIFRDAEDKKGVQASGELKSWYRPEYVDLRGVVIKKARVDRCRPIFRHWGLRFTVGHDSDVTKGDIKAALERNALGDFRPRFGRFAVVKFE